MIKGDRFIFPNMHTKVVSSLTSIIFLFCFIFNNYIFAQQGSKPTIAVIDFEGQNVSSMDALVITDFLRTALVNSKHYKVVDRKNMEILLSEQGLQMTGCTTEECAVKIGKLLNVQKMVIGSMSKLADKYYITANIVDVETGQIIVSKRVKCNIGDDLDIAIDKLTNRLIGKESNLSDEFSKDDEQPNNYEVPYQTDSKDRVRNAA